VASAKVAPKSIGVEFLEGTGSLLLSVGYRDDEAAHTIKLASVLIGKLDTTSAAGLTKLEQAMATASGKHQNIICHELYVTDEKDLLMVFMTHQAG
jgi:hypothetical protein